MGERNDLSARLAARVSGLEATLADSKIADRVRGLLQEARPEDAVETVLRHVEQVLRKRQVVDVLERMLRDAEDEVHERSLAGRAKAILQVVHGMSEEEAHLHLRTASRRSRRPIKEIAKSVVEARGESAREER
jgi:hypothetical protein